MHQAFGLIKNTSSGKKLTLEISPSSFHAVHFALPTKSNAPGLGELHFPILPYEEKKTTRLLYNKNKSKETSKGDWVFNGEGG